MATEALHKAVVAATVAMGVTPTARAAALAAMGEAIMVVVEEQFLARQVESAVLLL